MDVSESWSNRKITAFCILDKQIRDPSDSISDAEINNTDTRIVKCVTNTFY